MLVINIINFSPITLMRTVSSDENYEVTYYIYLRNSDIEIIS